MTHTPKIGIRRSIMLLIVSVRKKSEGLPGPGDSTTRSGLYAPESISRRTKLARLGPLRQVTTSAPVCRR
jgi:hypothetical protein